MIRPERRTGADVIAAVSLVAALAVVGTLIWWTSDARATLSRPATDSAPAPGTARAVPTEVTALWSAASPVTTAPVVVSGVVITGAASEVLGRDAATGARRWSYARGDDLCAVSWIQRYAVAIYPDRRGCGQVSTLDAETGRRGPARSGYADKTVHVSSTGQTVVSHGARRLELWRSDMVRVLSYGEIDARVKSTARGIGQGCTMFSAAGSSAAAAVLEQCQDADAPQLTLLRADREEDEPKIHPVPVPGATAASGARVLAVATSDSGPHPGTTTAVYLPAPRPRVQTFDEDGHIIATVTLSTAPTAASRDVPVSRAGSLITWWTGDAVLTFDAATLAHHHTIRSPEPTGTPAEIEAEPLGPATIMAGRLLIPVRGGLAVHDLGSGARQRLVPVDRAPDTVTVFPAVCGTTILEQRGDTVVALG